jgi:cell division protein FtsL
MMSRVRLIETTLLVLIGVLLAAATINDVVRQAHVNQRLVADLSTWRQYTNHDYHNISIDQETLGAQSQHEVLCGNTSPGPPGSKTQICLEIWGPVIDGARSVHGGWYLPPYVEDLRADRYGCFGSAVAAELCPSSGHAAGASHDSGQAGSGT